MSRSFYRTRIKFCGMTRAGDVRLAGELSWYDNEWGFATRMADTALVMAKFL